MNATAGATARDILGDLRQRQVRFLLLQFTDLLGVNKAVEVPPSQFERALAGEVVFDGSALEGFARVEEADALLVPDRDTFRVFPWAAGAAGGQGGRWRRGGGRDGGGAGGKRPGPRGVTSRGRARPARDRPAARQPPPHRR